MIRFGTPVFHPATFVPKTVYDRIGGFGTSFKIAMDYDLILRAHLARVPFVRVPQPLAGFRCGGLSDRKPLDGFCEVRRSQLANGLNRPLVETLHAARRARKSTSTTKTNLTTKTLGSATKQTPLFSLYKYGRTHEKIF
jgi:hypothetical protein